MDRVCIHDSCTSITEGELRLIGELLVASYNARTGEQRMKQVKEENASGKHSAWLTQASALKYEAEKCRLLSCLYELAINRPSMEAFVDELANLIK